MIFEWDDAKSEQNVSKHGLSFNMAEQVFDGPCLTSEDLRFDYEERRFITFGFLEARVVVIAYAVRSETVRIISMRKADKGERKLFEEQLGPARRHRRG